MPQVSTQHSMNRISNLERAPFLMVIFVLGMMYCVQELASRTKVTSNIHFSEATIKHDISDENFDSNNENRTIQQISILGERNSGTTWTTSHLRECFGDSIPVHVKLVRHKHWFQHDVVEKSRVSSTLVLAQFRNPYDWVEAMRNKNYRAPMHHKKDWETFVTTPWTMPERLNYDVALLKSHGKENKGVVNTSAIECQSYFTYNQINSCLYEPYLDGDIFEKRAEKRAKKKDKYGNPKNDSMSGQEPFYELRNDGSGMPYSTIVQMRSDKIRNFLDVSDWDWVVDLLSVRYEDLVQDGTASMIEYIEKVSGVKAKCKPYPPQDRSPRELDAEFVDWISEHVDWDTERIIGYERRK